MWSAKLLASRSEILELANEVRREVIKEAIKRINIGPAHTYASENADMYRGFDRGTARSLDILRSLCDERKERT